MSRAPILLCVALLVTSLAGGCPPMSDGMTPPGGDMTDPNDGGAGGGGGMAPGDTNQGDGGDDGGNGDNGDTGGNGGGNGDGQGEPNGSEEPGALLLRSLSLDERNDLLGLHGEFGDTEGVVYINNTARALAGKGWSNNVIEVALHPQDLGEVYVQVGGQVSNPRWITGWDFTVRRTQAARHPSVCPDCKWKATWRFRVRGDVLPVEFGDGQMTAGGTAGPGVRGATFTLDSVTGHYILENSPNAPGTGTLTKEDTSPVYFPDPTPPTGGGEWFSAYAGIDPANARAIIAVHVDTDGMRWTNPNTGETGIDHISFFGVFSNLSHPHTLVVNLSPSLNIPAGSTPPDDLDSFFEWEAAPVQSPPPPGSLP